MQTSSLRSLRDSDFPFEANSFTYSNGSSQLDPDVVLTDLDTEDEELVDPVIAKRNALKHDFASVSDDFGSEYIKNHEKKYGAKVGSEDEDDDNEDAGSDGFEPEAHDEGDGDDGVWVCCDTCHKVRSIFFSFFLFFLFVVFALFSLLP